MIHPAQKAELLDLSMIKPNLYNPNTVFSPEMELLKVSILEDGFIFPIVVLDKSIHIEGLTDNADFLYYTVIDGAYRTKLCKTDEEIRNYMKGLIPAIILNPPNPIATTVRLNRAKGVHGVMPMANIIKMEKDRGSSVEYMMKTYGMEKEEVVRLATQGGIPKSELIANTGFNPAWVPE